MALVVNDRVQQTGTANTTVSFTLSGSVSGYQSFAIIGNTNTTYYSATDTSGNWEVGLGTYSTTGPTLTRTTILSSSNAGAAVTFSGTVTVFCTYPSEKSVYQDASTNVTLPANITANNFTAAPSASIPTNGVYLSNTSYLGLSTGSTARVVIDSNGKTAIGTTLTSGNAMLTTNGSSGQGIELVNNNNGGTLFAATATGGVQISTFTGTIGSETYTERMRIGSAGGVSIGNTTDPGATNLSVTGTIASASTVTGTQLISNIAIGTAPLVVTSTTNVPNLNASSLSGATFAAPGAIGSTTASTGAFTTLSSTSDATINGQTIGKGLASVATNTAHGTSALAAITTGNNNVGLGYQALAATTGGNFNIALGSTALAANTSGGSNTAIGYGALSRSVSGSNNISIGQATLPLNTIGSSNVAVGHQAGNGLTSGLATLGTITAGTGYTNGTYNTVAFSYVSGPTASNYGLANVTVAGGVVTAVVIANVGSGWTGTGTVLTVANTLIGGTGSGFSVPVATLNSGSTNTLIGYSAGSSITTGSNNTLIGGYTGNSAPLSNTGSNYIVLSNGTPTIGAYFDGTNWTLNGLTNVTAVNATGTTAPPNGIYSPATSILALSANSAERLRVNGTGSIGLSGANYGTTGQVLSSNGSTSAASWITVGGTGTVTSVAALTLGTTGTDLSSTVATGTTTPVITLNVPTASATNRGALSSADWTTFNNKQPAGSYLTAVTADTPLSGSGTSGSHLVIAQSNTTTSGYLSFTDWNTFNGKGNGTVTSVGGTGTVNGITLTGTVTASGNLTLGGTLDLSSPPSIGNTAPNSIAGTTVTANASVTTSGNQGAFSYGTLGYSDTNILASYASSVAGYNQIVLQNTSNNANASTNFNVSNDAATSTTNYGEFGINSSTFTGTGSFNSAGYVYLTSASTDLAIGTYGANAVHFVTNSSAIDAGSISSTGQWAFNNSTTNTTATALVHLGAGTATANTAPLKLTSGTNLTTAEAGTVEYDGSNFYSTADTSQGRNINLAVQQFQLSAAGSALSGATQNYFGATSAASLAAASTYDIECYCYFLKTTSGTVQWIPTVSSAFTVGHCALEYTPVTGFTTTVITGAMVLAEATIQTSTTLTNVATASLTSAVYHVHKMKIRIRTNAACNFRLNATISAGSITPQAGSFYTVRKVVSNAGNFVA